MDHNIRHLLSVAWALAATVLLTAGGCGASGGGGGGPPGQGPDGAPDELDGTDEPSAAPGSGDSDGSDDSDHSGLETGVMPDLPTGDEVGGATGLFGSGSGEFQSGTLTAGSFDDNLNYDAYKQFVSQMRAADGAGALPEVSPDHRVIILVSDEGGTGVHGARVVVTPVDEAIESAALVDLPTGTDGRALVVTGQDGGEGVAQFAVTVYPPDGGDPVTQTMSAQDPQWVFTLPGAHAAPPTQLDLAFVVDTTGSMGDELEFLKVEVGDIAASVRGEFPDVDQRYALVVYRDEGDVYVTRPFDFTDRLEEFTDTLDVQFAAGGGDIPEAMHLALEEAQGLSWRAAETAKVVFLLTDAPPHPEFTERTLKAFNSLRAEGVAIYPVAASGTNPEAEFILRTAAVLTLSQYLFLTDDSGFGLSHSEPDIPCYVVERLDRVMTRMITSELSGVAAYPEPQDGIRTVGNPVDGVCLPENSD